MIQIATLKMTGPGPVITLVKDQSQGAGRKELPEGDGNKQSQEPVIAPEPTGNGGGALGGNLLGRGAHGGRVTGKSVRESSFRSGTMDAGKGEVKKNPLFEPSLR